MQTNFQYFTQKFIDSYPIPLNICESSPKKLIAPHLPQLPHTKPNPNPQS